MAGYKKAFSLKEDHIILKAFVDTNQFYAMKGTLFWKDLENSCLLPGRTWQSLKNRFTKSILPNIYEPSYKLSKENKDKFILACEQIKWKSIGKTNNEEISFASASNITDEDDFDSKCSIGSSMENPIEDTSIDRGNHGDNINVDSDEIKIEYHHLDPSVKMEYETVSNKDAENNIQLNSESKYLL